MIDLEKFPTSPAAKRDEEKPVSPVYDDSIRRKMDISS